MSSRFLNLFKRGRYVSTRSIAHDESQFATPAMKHEERERFAVAAVAFCLEYDREFKKHFLKQIAPGLRPTEIQEIKVEPHLWGDLVLEGPRHAVVLEFKLGALLADHQNPETLSFSVNGYGAEISRVFGGRKRVKYVVVGSLIPTGTKNGIEYSSVPWSAFLREERKGSLEADLYDCLGVLGAPAFIGRNMKRKNLTDEAAGAMDVYKLLEQAARNLCLGKLDSGIEHIGVELSAKGRLTTPLHAALAKLVKPPGKALGWIGYEKLDFGLSLSVWFYAAKQQTKVLEAKLQALNLGEVRVDQNSVGLSSPAKKQGDHMKWFESVLAVQ